MKLRKSMEDFVGSAGHKNGFFLNEENRLLKKFQPDSQYEIEFLKRLAASEDTLLKFTPKLYGVSEIDGVRFIEMENLLSDVKNPSVMDVKIGSKTFIDCPKNDTKRHDLYQKMNALCPNEATQSEQTDQKISKTRYLKFRDSSSTSESFSFRIEGIQIHSNGASSQINKAKLQSIKNLEAALRYIRIFTKGYSFQRKSIYIDFYEQLKHISEFAKASSCFKSHNMIGTSLLFIIGSDGKCKLKLIDFAKCRELTPGEAKIDGWEAGIETLKTIFYSIAYADHKLIDGSS